MSQTQNLRSLPSVDEVLHSERIAGLVDRYPRAVLVDWIREAVDDCRTEVREGRLTDAASVIRAVIDHVRTRSVAEQGTTQQKVINATGVLLHTNLGRAPLADRAIDRINQAVRYTNVELNLDTGKRSQRGERICRLLARLSAAEDALVVNNCAAATMLVLQAIAAGREVIVSRGQLVEIGGGFRLPDVFQAAGVELREVGTTNRTYLRDYENAINERTGAIIRVHRSNFWQSGFVTEPSIDELVASSHGDDIPVIDDLGSGCMHDLSSYGLREPTVPQSVAAGADLSLFSGDKLFGGPQCGIIVGRRRWIEKLRCSPMMRAVRVDKITLAALEATTEIHLSGTAMEELPLLRMIAKDADQVKAQCISIRDQVSSPSGISIEVVPSESQVGGGAAPGASLASFSLQISGCKIDELSAQLRLGIPAVQTRAVDDHLLLDLRAVADDEVESLVGRLRDSLLDLSRKRDPTE